MATPPGLLTAALDALWGAVRNDHRELPDAHVTLSPTKLSTNHDSDRWTMLEDGTLAGLRVDADTLRVGPKAVLTTILHEAAHILCWLEGTPDVTTRGRYHNGVYLDSAQRVGLLWPFEAPSPGVGYASPVPTDQVRLHYEQWLHPLAPAIEDALPYLVVSTSAKRSTQAARVSISCQCDPPRLARMSRTVLDRGPITCGVCGEPFTPADE